ncbi:cytochrome P450 [Volvox carteri f. nagariensis]|uniref:Cytochrome P450 n=1 Tax=Volvox carteri f. nagariensis TaxID=3068 RepID=D8U3E2_VOLCA|nr:cytochrome P450 [Volvox carteri f. nagariensis]EFJ45811.1 cytochrome P450 [Volvox carteri f. nagariensis]|eukprot:XP_002953212.1 cytochrome P450 [Volvox carteri f. nagariensis]
MAATTHWSPLADLLADAGSATTLLRLVPVVLLGGGLLVYIIARTALFIKDYMRISRALAKIPTAPGSLPLLGNVIPMITCVRRNIGAWDLMEEWLDNTGPIVKFSILGTQGVVFRDPSALKRVFQTGYKMYEKDLDVSYRPFLPILGSGLVTADGALWQKQRMLMGPALRVDVLDDIVTIAKKAVDRLCEKLAHHAGKGQSVNIEEEFRLLTLQVIGEAVLSMAPEECDRVFPSLYLPVMNEANHRVLRPYRMYLPTPEWFRFRTRMSQLNEYLIDLFRRRWESRQRLGRQKPADILDRIMEAIEESGAKWDAALETQLCYEIKTFLLAGHETSAAMLTWSTFELAMNEKATNKVQAGAPGGCGRVVLRVVSEAEAAFGLRSEKEANRRNVDEMIFTLAVLKEALRKYSVVPVVTRKLVRGSGAADDPVGVLGHPLPKGIMVACHLQGTHRLYEAPDEFRPERFMPEGEYDSFDDAIRAYMFVPFIQGPRNCLGQHLALLEARVVLSLLHKRFKFRVVDGDKVTRMPTVIPVGPTGGLNVVLEQRTDAQAKSCWDPPFLPVRAWWVRVGTHRGDLASRVRQRQLAHGRGGAMLGRRQAGITSRTYECDLHFMALSHAATSEGVAALVVAAKPPRYPNTVT